MRFVAAIHTQESSMAEQKANAEKGDGIAVFAEEGVGVLFGDRAGKMVGKTVGRAVDISDKAVGGTLGAVGLRDRGDIEARGSAASRSAGGATPTTTTHASPQLSPQCAECGAHAIPILGADVHKNPLAESPGSDDLEVASSPVPSL